MKQSLLIKRILSNMMSFCGVHSLFERICFSDKALVLMYHRVISSFDDQPFFVEPGMYISAETFGKQIAFLKDRFEVIFFEELVNKVLNGENVGGLCAITFDDGWRDNYMEAFPVLKKHCVPATIFLATGFVGTDRMFWPEETCFYLERNMVGDPAFTDAPLSYIRFRKEISKYHLSKRETLFDKAIELLKGYSSSDREEILGYFRSIINVDAMPRQMLDWNEAREMLSSGLVKFGAHTVNHEILDQVPLKTVLEEVTKSRSDIEYNLGCIVNTFAYPNGNNTENIQKILAESGFNAAVTTHKGLMDRDVPLMEVSRIAIHEDVSNSIPMFRSRILFNKF